MSVLLRSVGYYHFVVPIVGEAVVDLLLDCHILFYFLETFWYCRFCMTLTNSRKVVDGKYENTLTLRRKVKNEAAWCYSELMFG